MTQLDARKRAQLPSSAFAYVDSRGRKRLPIHDEAHVRNALARFDQVRFEDEAARDRARTRLLGAAKKYGIVPVGFMTGQLRTRASEAAAGRLVIELGRLGAPGDLEQQLRGALRDPTLSVLQWSDSTGGYLDAAGQPAEPPAEGDGRAVTLLERHGRPMTAMVHDPAILADPDLVKNVMAAVRLTVENERLLGEVEARATEVKTLPAGFVTFLLSDIEGSTTLIGRLGERYAPLLTDVRRVIRTAVRRAGGREIDARADEFFAAFAEAKGAIEAALSIQQALRDRAWPDDLDVRVRIGVHSGRPTLTDTGYVGLAVHTAARVCSAAHGGQIVLSGSARDALEEWQPADAGYRSLGLHSLHGLPEPLALFELEVSDLRTDIAPPAPTPESR